MKKAGTLSAGFSSRKCPMVAQRGLLVIIILQAARMKQSKKVNKLAMKHLCKSDPFPKGYRKEMISMWKEKDVCDTQTKT